MKVTHTSITSSTDTTLSSERYNTALHHINKAIEALGVNASKGDEFARECIANLSVVMLDINSQK